MRKKTAELLDEFARIHPGDIGSSNDVIERLDAQGETRLADACRYLTQQGKRPLQGAPEVEGGDPQWWWTREGNAPGQDRSHDLTPEIADQLPETPGVLGMYSFTSGAEAIDQFRRAKEKADKLAKRQNEDNGGDEPDEPTDLAEEGGDE